MKGKLEELTMEELDNKLEECKENIRVSRFKTVTGNLQNSKAIRDNKRQVARILTLKTEYEKGIREKK